MAKKNIIPSKQTNDVIPSPKEQEQILKDVAKAENSPINLRDMPKKKSKKVLYLIIFILLVALGAGGFFLYNKYFASKEQDKSAVQKTKEETSNINKIIGKSDGTFPYAEIDEEKVVSRSFNNNGGVIHTTLSNSVEAYLVMPEGSVIMDAEASIIPYKEMPSGESHGKVSDNLGYGAYIDIKSAQMGLGGYVVFDTTGGKAVEEAAKKSKYYNRCDPRFKWFNPFLCARKNKVRTNEVVKKDQAVISPIFNEDFDGLVFTKNTIPLGIDGLVVAEVTGSGVYVPQKIDKELAESFIDKTLGSYQNYSERTEAGGLALEWSIDLDYEKRELVSDSIAGETYQQMAKGLYVVKEYIKKEEAKLKEIESRSTSDDDDEYDMEDEIEDQEDLIALFKEAEEDEEKNLLGDIGYDTKEFGEVESIEATAAADAASDLGVEGADGALDDAMDSIEDTLEGENGSTSELEEALDAAEAAQYAGDEQAESEAMDRVEEAARKTIEDTINDPNATIQDLMKAAELAQKLGLDDLAEQAFEKLKEKLEEMLKDDSLTKEELYDIAALAQMLGFENVANNALEKAKNAPFGMDCDLVKKNLSNFGINTCGGEGGL